MAFEVSLKEYQNNLPLRYYMRKQLWSCMSRKNFNLDSPKSKHLHGFNQLQHGRA